MPSLVLGVPESVLSLVQEGLIEREFHDGLFPNLAYRAEFASEKWEGQTGTEVLMTRPGLLAPKTAPLTPGQEPTPQNVPYEQWTMRLDQYADTIDTDMPTSAVANSNLFLRNVKQLGLGAGVVTGTELQHMSDDEVVERLPELHVFGRVAPEDKLRLAKLMQDAGEVVAMTGDAVNDAAALKQADIGVAMGSGSEVSKQAAKIVLTDDNFATLVRAVDLGRDIYRRISSYIRLQLTILSSVLQLMLLATIFNINGGVALFPMQLLFCKFFVVVTVVVGFIADVPDPGVMDLPPRRPGTRIVNPPQIVRWAISGFLVAVSAILVLELGPDEPSATAGSVSMTMAFAVVALSAVNLGVVMRRERQAPWSSPMFPYFGWLIAGWTLTWAAVELGMLQRLLDTVSLTGGQWLVAIGLSLITPAFVGVDKAIQLRRLVRASGELGARPADAPPSRVAVDASR